MAEPNPNPPVLDSETVARFWSKVDRNGPLHPSLSLGNCWMWTAGTFRQGYGQFKTNGRNLKSHRVAYYLATGEWPEQLICHSCDRPGCCNPSHLFVGTNRDNLQDCQRKGRLNTACGERHRARKHPELVLRGEGVGNSKLTEEQVKDICMRYAAGGISQQAIADEYGVDRKAISFIIRGTNWAHLGVDVARLKEVARQNQYTSRSRHR